MNNKKLKTLIETLLECILQEEKNDPKQLSGKLVKSIGNKIGIDWNEIDFNEFKEGISVEFKEHGKSDPQTNVINNSHIKAAKIALAHLKELPDYYTKLKQIEKD
jgi:hypothetical protein